MTIYNGKRVEIVKRYPNFILYVDEFGNRGCINNYELIKERKMTAVEMRKFNQVNISDNKMERYIQKAIKEKDIYEE